MIGKRGISVLLGVVLLCTSFTVLGFADKKFKFKKLSKDHLHFGVSQLVAGTVPGGNTGAPSVPLRLMNPGRVSQVSAVFVYERTNEEFLEGRSEVYAGCIVRVLTPHAAIGVGVSSFPVTFSPLYAEVLSAPVAPVTKDDSSDDDSKGGDSSSDDSDDSSGKKGLRAADGLGIVASAGRNEENFQPVHPWLFTLPSNDVVEGQHEAAQQCVCDELAAQQLDPRTFEPFGVDCGGSDVTGTFIRRRGNR